MEQHPVNGGKNEPRPWDLVRKKIENTNFGALWRETWWKYGQMREESSYNKGGLSEYSKNWERGAKKKVSPLLKKLFWKGNYPVITQQGQEYEKLAVAGRIGKRMVIFFWLLGRILHFSQCVCICTCDEATHTLLDTRTASQLSSGESRSQIRIQSIPCGPNLLSTFWRRWRGLGKLTNAGNTTMCLHFSEGTLQLHRNCT